MTKLHNNVSEMTAESAAMNFLTEYIGDEVFLGSQIEHILAENAYVIYQEVDDTAYFGAALHVADKHLIAINTKQVLRTRYYSAAHELWHLLYESGKVLTPEDVELDQERAADRFAAAVMIPKNLLKNLLQHSGKEQDAVTIIGIADMSAVPYVAVVRRIHELGIEIQLPKKIPLDSDDDWIKLRSELGVPPSPLDQSFPFTEFRALTDKVTKLVNAKEITLEVAANLVKHVDPVLSNNYWDERQKMVESLDDED